MAYATDGRAIARDVLREGIFWTADLLEAANELVPVIRDRRPQVLITYDQIGNYGHPDHIQAHRVAMYATLLAGVPSYRRDLGEPWTVARVFWCTMSKSRMLAGIQAPVLLIHGRYDRMVAFEVSIAILNHVADSRVVLLNNCGHWPPFEKPAEYTAHVLAFLRGY